MPIYEYECLSCDLMFQNLVMNKDEEADLVCPACGGRNLNRVISRVAYHVSEQDRIAEFDPRAVKTDSFYKDPRNIGLEAKRRARQMGVTLGDGFEAKLDRIRTDPSSVIKDGE